MAYRFLDVSLERPLSDVSLTPNESGIAVLVRRDRRPVAFWLEPLPAGTRLPASTLKAMIAEHAGTALLTHALQDELRPEPNRPAERVTVAVCTKDRPSNVARCLAALAATTPPPFEILVVDNAPSNDATRSVVAAHPDVRYLREPRPGLDFARNRAVVAARGDWVAFVDDDVVVDDGWLEGFYEALGENPDAGAITGLILPYSLETEAQVVFERQGGFRRGVEKKRFSGPVLPGNPLYPCGAGIFGAGANMAFRRRLLLDLGGFDEALDTGAPLPGGGDLDMFYRVVRSGAPLIYEPRFLVFHEHRAQRPALRHQYYTWGLGLMAFIEKSRRTDPPQRTKFRRLIGWWFRYQLKQVAKSLLGRHPLPVSMALAELGGGIVGLFGEYARSERRIHRIRQTHDS